MQKHYLVLYIQELINVNVTNLYIQAELLQIWKSSRTWTLLDHDKHYIVVVPVLELLTKLKIGKHRGEEIKFQRFYMFGGSTLRSMCNNNNDIFLQLRRPLHVDLTQGMRAQTHAKKRYVFHTNCIFYVFLMSHQHLSTGYACLSYPRFYLLLLVVLAWYGK